ncbi:MAG: TIM barrel protein, partial [Bauldia litoralis]
MADWKLAYHANCWGPLGGNAVGVTSITELTYRTFGDMAAAMGDIAAAGYTGVELFDGNLLDYSEADFRSLLADTGLSLVATYSGGNFIFDEILGEELARVRKAADHAAALGAEHLV